MSKITFCTISITWDIFTGVKTFCAPSRAFRLVTIVTGYHFEFFFDIFKTINMYTPYLDTSH